MKIKEIKKINGKYKIILEDKIIITYDDVMLKYQILFKKEIDEKLLQIIEKENEYYESYNKIIKYLNIKLRSENEIKKYMNKLYLKKDTQEKILEQLKKLKLIDDYTYIKSYIHDRITLSNDGPLKIKKELKNENIDEFIIENELEKIDKEKLNEKLEKLIIKKIKSNTKYSEKILREKIINYFTTLGYEKNNIIEILDNNRTQNADILKKEYEKIYNKLKTKYEDEKLNIIIKQKLYQKGFDIDEINKIIN